MSRVMMTAVLFTSVALTAACGGAKSGSDAASDSGKPAQASASAAASAADSAFAGKTALQIWAESVKAAKAAKSVHVTANIKADSDTIKVDLRLSDSSKGSGSLTVNGGKAEIIQSGKAIYFKGDDKFWSNLDATAGKSFANKWIKSSADDPKFGSFLVFTDMDQFTQGSLTLDSAAEKKNLKRVAGKTINGQPTVGLEDSGPGLATDKSGTLYVAATGPALPLELRPAEDKDEFITFDEWNEPVTVKVPQNAHTL